MLATAWMIATETLVVTAEFRRNIFELSQCRHGISQATHYITHYLFS